MIIYSSDSVPEKRQEDHTEKCLEPGGDIKWNFPEYSLKNSSKRVVASKKKLSVNLYKKKLLIIQLKNKL